MRGRRRVLETKAFDGLLELFAEDGIIITDDIFCGVIESKGLTKLLDGPLRMRFGTDSKMQYLSPIMRDGDKDINCLKEQCPNDKEVNGNDVFGVIFQERFPPLAFIGIRFWLFQVFENGIVADGKAELAQFALNPLRRPERIFLLQPSNKLNQWPVNSRATGFSGLPPPVELKPLAVPTDDGFGLDDHQRFLPFSKNSEQPDPEDAICICNSGPFDVALLDEQLLPENQIFKNDFLFIPEKEPEQLQDERAKHFQAVSSLTAVHMTR